MRSLLYVLFCICIVSAGQSQPAPVVPHVKIRVLDRETLQPIDARIMLTNQHADPTMMALFENGSYKYKLTVKDTVTISIHAAGYHLLNESLFLGDLNGVETFYLTPNRDAPVTREAQEHRSILPDEINTVIYFSQSQTQITPRSALHLERVGAYLQNNRVSSISLEGHTDNTGDPDKNRQLSIDRNSVVRAYLLQSGDLAGMISSKSFGGDKPAAPNDNEQNKRFNRRVELRISPQP